MVQTAPAGSSTAPEAASNQGSHTPPDVPVLATTPAAGRQLLQPNGTGATSTDEPIPEQHRPRRTSVVSEGDEAGAGYHLMADLLAGHSPTSRPGDAVTRSKV